MAKNILDGGISMPSALSSAPGAWYDKIVLGADTGQQDHRKQPGGRWVKRVKDRYFAPLPEVCANPLRDEIRNANKRIQEELDRLGSRGRGKDLYTSARDPSVVEVSRLEQAVHQIQALYDEGRGSPWSSFGFKEISGTAPVDNSKTRFVGVKKE